MLLLLLLTAPILHESGVPKWYVPPRTNTLEPAAASSLVVAPPRSPRSIPTPSLPRGPRLHGDAVDTVNVFVGTSGGGNTFPGATLPFGLVQASPVNAVRGLSPSGYAFGLRRKFAAVAHTALSGTGVGDGLDLLFKPCVGAVTESGRASFGGGCRTALEPAMVARDSEEASPGYWTATIAPSRWHAVPKVAVRVEVTTTRRAVLHRYTFQRVEDDDARFATDDDDDDEAASNSNKGKAGTGTETARKDKAWVATLLIDANAGINWDKAVGPTQMEMIDVEVDAGRKGKAVQGQRCSMGWTSHCVFFFILFDPQQDGPDRCEVISHNLSDLRLRYARIAAANNKEATTRHANLQRDRWSSAGAGGARRLLLNQAVQEEMVAMTTNRKRKRHVEGWRQSMNDAMDSLFADVKERHSESLQRFDEDLHTKTGTTSSTSTGTARERARGIKSGDAKLRFRHGKVVEQSSQPTFTGRSGVMPDASAASTDRGFKSGSGSGSSSSAETSSDADTRILRCTFSSAAPRGEKKQGQHQDFVEREVVVRVGISHTSIAAARENLMSEMKRSGSKGRNTTEEAENMDAATARTPRREPYVAFDDARADARATWQRLLNRWRINEDATKKKKRHSVRVGDASTEWDAKVGAMVRTALYHVSLGPTIFGDAEPKQQQQQQEEEEEEEAQCGSYSGVDGFVHCMHDDVAELLGGKVKSVGDDNATDMVAYYSSFSLWDTNRQAHPLLLRMLPVQQYKAILASLLAFARQSRAALQSSSEGRAAAAAAQWSEGVRALRAQAQSRTFGAQRLKRGRLSMSSVAPALLFGRDTGRGVLPKWPLYNTETGCMIGAPAVPVLGDALLAWSPPLPDLSSARMTADPQALAAAAAATLSGLLARRAVLDEMVRSLTTAGHGRRFSAAGDEVGGQMDETGTDEGDEVTALFYVERFGHIPAERVSQSVSRGLEIAAADYCVARVATSLRQDLKELHRRLNHLVSSSSSSSSTREKGLGLGGDGESRSSTDGNARVRMASVLGEAATEAAAVRRTEKAFWRRSRLYEEYFDNTTGLMRPRLASGAWKEPFNPRLANQPGGAGGSDFTEASAWEYSFNVADIPALVALHGGPRHLESRLDTFFTPGGDATPEGSELGKDISAKSLLGGYAPSNEPSLGVAYLYNHVGKPFKTQAVLQHVLTTAYDLTPGGLPGNDDYGALSAWLAWSALGLFPMHPCTGRFDIGRPLIREASLVFNVASARKGAKTRRGRRLRTTDREEEFEPKKRPGIVRGLDLSTLSFGNHKEEAEEERTKKTRKQTGQQAPPHSKLPHAYEFWDLAQGFGSPGQGRLTIRALNQSATSPFVQQATLGGRLLTRPFIMTEELSDLLAIKRSRHEHEDDDATVVLEFIMGPEPSLTALTPHARCLADYTYAVCYRAGGSGEK